MYLTLSEQDKLLSSMEYVEPVIGSSDGVSDKNFFIAFLTQSKAALEGRIFEHKQ